jgi:FMN phosphatase YigB (HAD superfamily)
MPQTRRPVFLFDVDNTLLDNDTVSRDLREHLQGVLGAACAARYTELFDELRSEVGYADYLGALQRYRSERERDLGILQVSSYLLEYPFASRVYPGAEAALRWASEVGTTAILSDGDVVFQPRKIARAGLADAVSQRVLIYIHKELQLDDVAARLPAQHYVLVDDKLRILDAVKRAWGPRVTTVFVRQGHYAFDPKVLAAYPAADVTVERVGDLASFDWTAILPSG